MTSAVFAALPGIEVPVGDISSSFARMWRDTAEQGGVAPRDLKATQLNLVLHFGFKTDPATGLAQFEIAVKFAQRCPCRVVVLCPRNDPAPELSMSAKVYGECFLGRSKGDTRCVEFVALDYPLVAREFLENQVSICLSTDLPLYYWVFNFSDSARLADYQYLLRRSKRVIIDTANAPADALAYPWPNPAGLRDLAHARILPLRQSIGQFVSGFAPEKIVTGLKSVEVTHAASGSAEAQALLRWLNERLAGCADQPEVAFTLKVEGPDNVFGIQFSYDNGKRFAWRGDIGLKHATFDADFGGGARHLSTPISLLEPASALSDAMFF